MAGQRPTTMNFAALQERLVPLIAELLATLASRNPLRMYFADIAGKTLHDIVGVLRQEGFSQEAIAASLGMTLNGYHAKMKRLRELQDVTFAEEESTEPRSLMERVHSYVAERAADGERVPIGDISEQFRGVKSDSLRGVLTFLVRSDLLDVEGRGRTTTYGVQAEPETGGTTVQDASAVLFREGPMSIGELCRRLGVTTERGEALTEELMRAGKLRVVEPNPDSSDGSDADAPLYKAIGFHIPMDTPVGYEAAIYDHVAAMVGALTKKLRLGRHSASMRDRIGGATFTFRVPAEHPLNAEISAHLAETRVKLEAWLKEADALPPETFEGQPAEQITVYVGQTIEVEP